MITREAKIIDFNKAFFPVEERTDIWCDFRGKHVRVSGYKAIMEMGTGRIMSVVSSKYRLIHNKEAYDLADHVVRTIFEGKNLHDFQCFNLHMPKTKSFCRLDLIIPNNFNELFGSKNESWTPFVRISNSYNKTMALKYDIGFCRWICMNGMIIGQTGVSFSLTHSGRITKGEINHLIDKARTQIGDISKLWQKFEKKMNTLHDIELPSSAALAIYCKAFGIKVKKDDISEKQKEVLSLKASQIVKACKNYFKEHGNNAYAMMNVLSDYASYPGWTDNRANYVDGYQRKVGKWVDDFIEESQKNNFSLSRYIGDEYQNTAYYLESLVPSSLL